MAKYRPIRTDIWKQSWFLNLSSEERYLYFYFITNPHTSLCGAYPLPESYILFEAGLNKSDYDQAMITLNGKVYYYDGWVLIKDFKRTHSNSEKIRAGIEREEDDLPRDVKDMLDHINEL